MSTTTSSLSAFLELANIYDQRDEPKMRDRFLILAADAANAAGQKQEAEQLMQRLLKTSPHHMMKAYRTFGEAAQADPVRVYIADLRQNYPPDIVRTLLESLRGKTAGGGPMKDPEFRDTFPFQPEPEATVVLPPAGSNTTGRTPRVEDAPTEKTLLARPARNTAKPSPAPAVSPPTRKNRTPRRQSSSWLAMVLFILVVVTGLALLGHALARPFLP